MKKMCVCRYCLIEIMSREKIMYRPILSDDEIETDDDGMMTCGWCNEKDDDMYVIE